MQLRVLAAVAIIAARVPAQVFIVDAANGAGANFTDLPAAVAAVPDGATLRVRAGVYSLFTLSGKGLRVMGEGSVTFQQTGSIVVTATRANQVVLLRDITLPMFGGIQLTDTVGPVILERCHRDANGILAATDVTALRAANVQLLGCNFDRRPALLGIVGLPSIDATDSSLSLAACRVAGNDGTPSGALGGQAGPGGAGLKLLRTRAVLSRCTLLAGSGGAGCRSCGIGCSADGGVGGPACRVENSTLVLFDSALQGGTGGVPGCCSATQQCTCPGNGGPGLALLNGVAFLLGRQPAGGSPGGTTCNAQAGPPIQQSGSNTLHVDAAARPPLARIDGTQATGQSINFTVLSPAGSVALMGIAYDAALLPIEPVGFGSLLAATAGYLGPFTVPTGDVLQLPWTIPAGFALGQVHYGQFLTLAGGIIFASNPFPLVVAQ